MSISSGMFSPLSLKAYTIRHRLWTMASFFIALLLTIDVLAAPQSSKLPDHVIATIVERAHPSSTKTSASTLLRHLEETSQIIHDLENAEKAPGSKSRSRESAIRSKGMLLRAKRVEMEGVHEEVRAEIEALRTLYSNLGLSQKVDQLNDFELKINDRFSQFDKAITQLARASTSKARGKALGKAKGFLKKYYEDPRVARMDLGNHPGPTPNVKQPPPSKSYTPSTNQPAYLSRLETYEEKGLYALVSELLLIVVSEAQASAPPTAPEAASCSYTTADLADDGQDIQITQEIRDLAESLNYSPARILEYVANEISFEPYYGALKGTTGTLYTKAGGATDQASFMIALLRASNIPARYVRGVIEVADTVPQGQNGRAARWIGTKSVKAAADVMAKGQSPTSIYYFDGTGIKISHVWVEACVPYANYRGMAFDNAGHRWVPMDPSFKDKTYQAGISANVNFDYTAFLASRHNQLPHEALEEQVNTAIKVLDENNTLADVPYAGSTNAVVLDILPTTLPYRVDSFTNWTNSGTPETAVLPNDHRYQINIDVNNGDIALALLYPDIIHDRLTLSYKGATPADQTALDAWVGDGSITSFFSCSINVIPVVKREGVIIGTGTGSVSLCALSNTLNVNVSLQDGRSYPDTANGVDVTFNNIKAANLYAIQGYAFQGSDRLLLERKKRLTDAINNTPDPNTDLEEIEGEFLHIVGLDYMWQTTTSAKRIGELHQDTGESGHHIGVAAAEMKIEYLFDLPFVVHRAALLVDMPGMVYRGVDVTTGDTIFDTLFLALFSNANYESHIWQKVVNLDAITTIRGIQLANETGIEVLELTSANWAAESPKFTSNANPALNYSAATVNDIKTNFIDQGYTVTAPRSLIEYNNWTGYVFEAHLDNLPASAFASFIIYGNLAGGLTTGDPGSSDPGVDSGVETPVPGEPGGTPTTTEGETDSTTTEGDPVNMVTGNMFYHEKDINIPGRGGLPFEFERYYNSRDPVDGPLGFGWTHNLNHQLHFKDNNYDGQDDAGDTDGITSAVVWVDGTGAERYFTVAGTGSGVPTNTTLTNSPGIFVTAKREADGTYSIRENDGLTYFFENVAGTAGQTPARLTSFSDRNGNTLSLDYTISIAQGGDDDAATLDKVSDGISGRELIFTNTSGRITEIQDWTGRQYQYQYDPVTNDLTTYLSPLAVTGNQSPVTYTYYTTTDGVKLDHHLRTYSLPEGNGMTFEYYANGKVFRHLNTLNETTTFTYNEFRRESTAINPRGYTRRFFFDNFGNLEKLIEQTGAERHYTYDTTQVHNRLSKTNPIGFLTQMQYDANGNVIQITNPSGGIITFSGFNSFNQPGKTKDANGNYTVLQYDASGNLTNKIHLKNGIDPGDPSTYVPNPVDLIAWTIYSYDVFGNRQTTTQVRDFTSQVGPNLTVTYDTNNLYPVSIERCGDRDGDGIITEPAECNTESLIYDSLGRMQQGINATWEVKNYQYDALNQITQGTDKMGYPRDLQYDDNGNSLSEQLVVNINGTLTQVDSSSATYDLSDRTDTQLDAGGFVTSFSYDPVGNIESITNPDNFRISIAYDENNRVIRSFDEEGHTVSRNLDPAGRARSITDPNGNTVTYSYYGSSKDGRLEKVIIPTISGSRETAYDYDLNGNAIAVTDNLGRTTNTSFDALNRPTRIVEPQTVLAGVPVRTVTKLSYDSLGNLDILEAGHTTDLSGNLGSDVLVTQTTDQYDDFGRKIRSIDPLGRSWNYLYDEHDNLTQSTDPKGQQVINTWGYGGQLLTRTVKISQSDPSPHITTWTRNSLGQIEHVTAPEVNYDYQYDAIHRPTLVTDSRDGKTLSYHWSPGGLLDKMDDSEGNETDYLYDPVGRLTGVWAPNGDMVIYGYDDGGRLIEKWLSNGVTTRYSYNPDNTLASLANTTDGASVISQHTYTYDGVGNRDTHAETIGATTTAYSYLYDALNQLTEVQVSGIPTETYTYDALGNRVTRTASGITLAYVYDNANQLNAIRLGNPAGADQVTFEYDMNGNLETKNDLTNGQTLLLSYDALNQTIQASLSGNPAENYQYDSSGRRIQKNVGAISTNYLYNGPGIHGEYDSAWVGQALYTHGPRVDNTILRNAGGSLTYYHQDGLSSVIGISDANGITTGTESYDAWGNTTALVGTSISQYGYTGREPDNTGLIFYRARYYDPEIGRFVQRDPLGLRAGINLYTYVTNNPINFNDPSGLDYVGFDAVFTVFSGGHVGVHFDTGSGGVFFNVGGNLGFGAGGSFSVNDVTPSEGFTANYNAGLCLLVCGNTGGTFEPVGEFPDNSFDHQENSFPSTPLDALFGKSGELGLKGEATVDFDLNFELFNLYDAFDSVIDTFGQFIDDLFPNQDSDANIDNAK